MALKLNGTQVGGRSKRNFHFYNSWCVKYLSGFRWEQLTESLVYEAKTKDVRLRAEISRSKKVNEHFIDQVAKAKEVEEIVKRKQRRQIPVQDPKKRKVFQHESRAIKSSEERLLRQVL